MSEFIVSVHRCFKMFKLWFGLALFGFAAASPTLKSLGDLKIVGGEDIDISEAPYQVSLLYRGRHSCGGTIISNELVITAAHCISNSNPNDYQIRAGSSFNMFGGELYPVGELIWHPDFSYSRMDSDIAVIWISKPIKFSDTIAAIEMFEEDEDIDDGEETIVTGWGHTEEGGIFPTTLQMVKIPTVSEEDCKKSYAPSYDITPRMLCAGLPNGGKDACQGDSGGPLVCNGKLAGVVSWGLGCARPKYPGVYAKVSALRPWLDDSITYLRMKHLFRAVL